MDKDQIKRLIVGNQNSIQKIKLLHRKFHFEDKGNYVFVGVRRAGKSYLMYQRAQELVASGIPAERILYINFEDDRLSIPQLEDLDFILRCYSEIYPLEPILFLDEIQIVAGWEKFVRRLADNRYRVYVTGSNAKMLSSEIMTTLGGRFLVQDVFPFSWAEMLSIHEIDTNNANWHYDDTQFSKAMRLYDRYFHHGGFPELINFDDKRSWLNSLYQKIFFGDLISRYEIRNVNALRLLIKKLAESVGQPISYNRMKNILASANANISINTIPKYIEYLTEALLVFSIQNMNGSFSEKETSRKYYFMDNGILNLFLFDPDTALMENLVALQLYKQFKDRLFFYRKNVETDFYVPDEQLLVQTCLNTTDASTFERETDSLLATAKFLKSKRNLIITKDNEARIEKNGIQIEVVPAWKWMLEGQ